MDKQFDPAKPVQTRGGASARIVATDANSVYPIIALVTQEAGDELAETYTAEGVYFAHGGKHSLDLVNVPERSERFFALYTNASPRIGHPIPDDSGPVIVEVSIGDWRLNQRSPTAVGIKLTYEGDKVVAAELAEV